MSEAGSDDQRPRRLLRAAGGLAICSVALALAHNLWAAYSWSSSPLAVELDWPALPAGLVLLPLLVVAVAGVVLASGRARRWRRPAAGVLTVLGVLWLPETVGALVGPMWDESTTVSTLLTLAPGVLLLAAGIVAAVALLTSGARRAVSARDGATVLLTLGAVLLAVDAAWGLLDVLRLMSMSIAAAFGSSLTVSLGLAVLAPAVFAVVAFALVDGVRLGAAAAGAVHALANAPAPSVLDASTPLAEDGGLTSITLVWSVAWTDLVIVAVFAVALVLLLRGSPDVGTA